LVSARTRPDNALWAVNYICTSITAADWRNGVVHTAWRRGHGTHKSNTPVLESDVSSHASRQCTYVQYVAKECCLVLRAECRCSMPAKQSFLRAHADRCGRTAGTLCSQHEWSRRPAARLCKCLSHTHARLFLRQSTMCVSTRSMYTCCTLPRA
jgi:hypothetical protein